ncbi:MAG: gliding motility-associated C-terminal domain-containing protein, partial [Crocinitomicaceae bacterium]|nr:gliding motility-associated C-terminal domain-containing protein [Crocinitomicaceae bacterium]
NGCDSFVTLDLTISNTVNGTDQQAACETFTWIDGNTYTASNNTATYTIVGGAANGCDSIVTLDLTIYANNSTIFTETFDSGTIAGANAPVLYGNGGSDFNPNYALSGTFFGWFNVQNGIGDVDIYEQNFTGLQIGCAVSVAVWMRSTIPVSDVTMTLSDDNGIILSVLDPILSGAWQLVTISATVTTSGLNFLVHFNSTGGNGLDVIMEDLTVTQSCGIDAIIAPVSDQCLNGNSFTFDGMNSLSSAGITSYIWDFGDNSPSINTPSAIYSYANSGTYDVNLNVSDGVCFDDTTIQVNVYEDPLIDNPSDVISCDTYVLPSLSFGNYYSGSDGSGILLNEGDIIDITQSVFVFEATNTVPSCSNENEFIVTINNTITTTDFETSCGPYTWIDGITYNESNTTAVYTYPNVTPSGCDSVVFLNLTVASPTAGTDVLTSCTPVIWIDGNTYTSSNNTATFTIIGGASNGCDSTVNLDLTISSAVYVTDIQVACETFTWIDGINYSSSNNTATFTYPNGAVAGCDSIVTLDLTVNNSISYLDVHESCDNFTWIDGNTYTENNTSASFIYPGGAANGCDSIVTLDLTINNLENLNPGIDLSICDGDSFTPNASGALYYSWSDGLINGSSFTPLIGLNEYTVTGTDINNCSAFASVFVNVSAVPSISFNTIDPFCKGEASGSIAIDIAGGTAPYFIEWSNQSNEANLPNIPAGTYNVIVSDDAGCETEATQILSDPLEPCYELPEASFYVPNSFTPDADEHNQNWFIILEGADPLSYSLRIYNRWGETIWESYDIEAKWDGTYRSLDVPEGTYTWQIEYQNLGESKRIYETGHINLLR